jgi:predicted nuclease of predicted toxin-antitoxin system
MTIHYRFLFDECLSPALISVARIHGFEATSVRDLGRLGEADGALAFFAINSDWVIVTNNRADFMRIYARFDLHPGLIVILPNVEPPIQKPLLENFYARIDELGDLTNKLVEIADDGRITIRDWPTL